MARQTPTSPQGLGSQAVHVDKEQIVMKRFAIVALAAVLASTLIAGQAGAADAASAKNQVLGQKIDSGLGELPHYRDWADKSGRNPLLNRVAGEKLDSGLGDIVPFSLSRSGLPGSVEVAQNK
jgi:hypothetical protein